MHNAEIKIIKVTVPNFIFLGWDNFDQMTTYWFLFIYEPIRVILLALMEIMSKIY